MSPGLHHEIWIHFILPDEMSVEGVLISIERVLQSDKKWLFAGTMRLIFVHADLPAGNGRMGPSNGLLSHRLTDMLRRKKSIIQIPKDQYDVLCSSDSGGYGSTDVCHVENSRENTMGSTGSSIC